MDPSTSAAPPQLDLDTSVPAELRRMVRSELGEDERIVWFGQPIPGRLARRSIPTVLFGVPWTAFAIFWVFMASKASALFALFGVPFILVGLAMLTSPFWAARGARRTAYVITTHRAMIVASAASGIARLAAQLSVRSFGPPLLQDLERSEDGAGVGDVIIARDLSTSSKGRTATTKVGFLAINDVAAVERKLRALANG